MKAAAVLLALLTAGCVSAPAPVPHILVMLIAEGLVVPAPILPSRETCEDTGRRAMAINPGILSFGCIEDKEPRGHKLSPRPQPKGQST